MRMIISKKIFKKQELDRGPGLMTWAEAIRYLRSSAGSKGLVSAACFQKSIASGKSLRIFGLRFHIGVVFQLCRIFYYFFSCET